jgi:hypothetical protein
MKPVIFKGGGQVGSKSQGKIHTAYTFGKTQFLWNEFNSISPPNSPL